MTGAVSFLAYFPLTKRSALLLHRAWFNGSGY
jgi:hypothetical protein